jgi:hypothetical protein
VAVLHQNGTLLRPGHTRHLVDGQRSPGSGRKTDRHQQAGSEELEVDRRKKLESDDMDCSAHVQEYRGSHAPDGERCKASTREPGGPAPPGFVLLSLAAEENGYPLADKRQPMEENGTPAVRNAGERGSDDEHACLQMPERSRGITTKKNGQASGGALLVRRDDGKAAWSEDE